MSQVRELNLYFISDPKVAPDYDGALATEASIVKDPILIKDIDDMLRRVVHACSTRGGRVKGMVIASHGNSAVFRIGENMMHKNDPRLWRLAVLRGLFTPNAVVLINACECGQDQELMQKVAMILGVTVIAYTGSINVYQWGIWEGIFPEGNKVVCTASGCQEIDARAQLQKAFERGPGQPPGWAREI